MIHVVCPKCGSKLNAKRELAGQTRKCPKCGTLVLIPTPELPETPADTVALDEPAPDQHPHGASDTKLPTLDVPKRLNRAHRYLICDKVRLAATWEGSGQGWMLSTNAGTVPAARNHDQLPAQGSFQLVELQLENTDQGLRLRNVAVFQLAQRWAMTKLERGDHQILTAVTGFGCLNRQQKNAVRKAIMEGFMHDVWTNAKNVLEYLGSTDYHSPGTL